MRVWERVDNLELVEGRKELNFNPNPKGFVWFIQDAELASFFGAVANFFAIVIIVFSMYMDFYHIFSICHLTS
jgi:hypothetical protein